MNSESSPEKSANRKIFTLSYVALLKHSSSWEKSLHVSLAIQGSPSETQAGKLNDLKHIQAIFL